MNHLPCLMREMVESHHERYILFDRCQLEDWQNHFLRLQNSLPAPLSVYVQTNLLAEKLHLQKRNRHQIREGTGKPLFQSLNRMWNPCGKVP